MPAPGSPAGDADPDRADFFADSGGVARFKITPDGALLKERPSGGGWVHTAPRVDFERLDATTDAEIERQEIADLVEDALELEAGSLTALAARLQVSPSSVRRWRRGRVMPSIAHQQRLKCLFAAL
jgi:DNA-binding transcriptional regulator YiaG